MTISVGIASAARGDDRRTLFAAADGVLYDAKRSGRDRVVRLSGVTQKRAGGSALDVLLGGSTGPAPAADDGTPEDDGFTPLVGVATPSDEAPVVPPLGVDRPGEPLLGPPATPLHIEVPASLPAVRRAPVPEVVRATGRTTEQVLALVREARREHPDRPALVLRAEAATLVALATEHDACTTMDAAAGAAAVGPLPEPVGRVAVICAGGADTPVAAEAAFVARVTGSEAVRHDDVAGSRVRALLADPDRLPDVDCLVVVAGMDAGLVATLGALTDVPVVAVPTSAGSAAGLGGLGALLTMLHASAPGVAVVDVDNGFSAGVFAARVARRAAR